MATKLRFVGLDVHQDFIAIAIADTGRADSCCVATKAPQRQAAHAAADKLYISTIGSGRQRECASLVLTLRFAVRLTKALYQAWQKPARIGDEPRWDEQAMAGGVMVFEGKPLAPFDPNHVRTRPAQVHFNT